MCKGAVPVTAVVPGRFRSSPHQALTLIGPQSRSGDKNHSTFWVVCPKKRGCGPKRVITRNVSHDGQTHDLSDLSIYSRWFRSSPVLALWEAVQDLHKYIYSRLSFLIFHLIIMTLVSRSINTSLATNKCRFYKVRFSLSLPTHFIVPSLLSRGKKKHTRYAFFFAFFALSH